ncbi:hypothetical protein Ahy_B06g080696 isoform B [Arachis hypogaea]|uniref:Uncharacterized protein n=1 Tax=Arachis hypogaea TaxID=3818 RepID=A0A444YIR3_ARAHY|nr:hypothetical protein Ahy_B06g080696 isoform B [Arachis hypogaea]
MFAVFFLARCPSSIEFVLLAVVLSPSPSRRQLEQEMETVIKVLQPGPLKIIEHKFSAEEIRKANDTVSKAICDMTSGNYGTSVVGNEGVAEAGVGVTGDDEGVKVLGLVVRLRARRG